MGFAKLSSTITESSLWSASKETRILFVSMLAKADAVGFVEASDDGLARIANLTTDETSAALKELTEPDPHDKSGVINGRRVLKVKGGYCIINYESYRNKRDDESRREYMREYMRKYRNGECLQPDVNNVNTVNFCKQPLAQAEAEAEAEAEADKKTAKKRVFVDPSELDIPSDLQRFSDDIKRFVEYRKEDKRDPFTKRAFDAFLCNLRRLHQDCFEITPLVDKAIASGWKTLFANQNDRKRQETQEETAARICKELAK